MFSLILMHTVCQCHTLKTIGEASYLIKGSIYDRSTILKSTTNNHYMGVAGEVNGEIDHGGVVRRCLNVAMHTYIQARPSSLWVMGLACGRRIAFIDSGSVAIAILCRLSTPTVSVNSLSLIIIIITSLVAIYFSETSNIFPVRVSNHEIWYKYR